MRTTSPTNTNGVGTQSASLYAQTHWECGTPKSLNNDFTGNPTRQVKYVQSKKLRLTKVEQSVVALMDEAEAKVYRNEIRKKRGMT
jgi:hypothetical protein